MERNLKARFVLMAGMLAAAALLRVLPHPWNFTPVGAMALFGGAHFASRRLALAMPLAALLLSDLAMEGLFRLGLYPHGGFYGGQWMIYASFAAVTFIGMLLRSRRDSVPVVAGGTLAGSTMFFLVTNFAVWAGGGPLYSPDAAGLAACYIAALPFFGGTLLGDVFYTALLFGAFALAERRLPLFAQAHQ